MPTFTEIDHLAFQVSDVTRTIDFYSRRLGLKLVDYDNFKAGKRPFASLVVGTSRLHVFPGLAEPVKTATQFDLPHLALVVIDDINQLYNDLKAEGVEVVQAPSQRFGSHGNGVAFYIRDPDGYVIEIKSYGVE